MDAISDPSVLEVWCKKSAQVGWTEILCNAVGYYIDQDPSPMLLMQPTLDMAETWSKDRLAPMLRDTPTLRGKVKDVRSRDSGNTILHKQFPGGHLTAAGANSAASLSSRPVRCFFGDEVNRYPVSAGTEGDPIKLGQKRTNNFWNRRFMAGSTPTTKGASRVTTGYEKSDQRKYYVPCPHCNEMQVLQWKFVKWPEGKPEDAYYQCPECGSSIDDSDRVEMIRKGEWRATQPFKGIAGFHVWEAYSPWRRLSEIVTDFLEANKGGPELLKVWVNTSLGEDWEDREGELMQAAELAERAGGYEPWTVPAEAVLAVAGCDVQHDRLEVSVYAFGPGQESWTVAHEVLHASPKDESAWQQLDDLLSRPIHRADGMALPISACAVDASDGQTTGFVLDACRVRRHRKVIAIKGVPGAKPEIHRSTKVEIKQNGRVIARGAELFPVGVDTIKGVLSERLKEEGWIHFPDGLPAAFYEQMCAEKLITKFKNGVAHKVWEKKSGARNEAWDCAVYAYAAAIWIGLRRANWKALNERLRPWAKRAAPVIEAPVPVVVAPKVKKPRLGLGSSDWNL